MIIIIQTEGELDEHNVSKSHLSSQFTAFQKLSSSAHVVFSPKDLCVVSSSSTKDLCVVSSSSAHATSGILS